MKGLFTMQKTRYDTFTLLSFNRLIKQFSAVNENEATTADELFIVASDSSDPRVILNSINFKNSLEALNNETDMNSYTRMLKVCFYNPHLLFSLTGTYNPSLRNAVFEFITDLIVNRNVDLLVSIRDDNPFWDFICPIMNEELESSANDFFKIATNIIEVFLVDAFIFFWPVQEGTRLSTKTIGTKAMRDIMRYETHASRVLMNTLIRRLPRDGMAVCASRLDIYDRFNAERAIVTQILPQKHPLEAAMVFSSVNIDVSREIASEDASAAELLESFIEQRDKCFIFYLGGLNTLRNCTSFG